jgi:hypothetical protein
VGTADVAATDAAAAAAAVATDAAATGTTDAATAETSQEATGTGTDAATGSASLDPLAAADQAAQAQQAAGGEQAQAQAGSTASSGIYSRTIDVQVEGTRSMFYEFLEQTRGQLAIWVVSYSIETPIANTATSGTAEAEDSKETMRIQIKLYFK